MKIIVKSVTKSTTVVKRNALINTHGHIHTQEKLANSTVRGSRGGSRFKLVGRLAGRRCANCAT